jgi:putative selenate reductase
MALEKGWDEYRSRWHKPAGSGTRHPVAVIGAGPAGLAAGYFLARAGHPVTLFEREANAGAWCEYHSAVPHSRRAYRTRYRFCVPPRRQSCLRLRSASERGKTAAEGFHYVLVGTGTDKNSGVKLGGDNQNVLNRCSSCASLTAAPS